METLNFGSLNNIYWIALAILFISACLSINKREKNNISNILPKISKASKRSENPLYKNSSISLIGISLILLVISLTRPQWGYELVESTMEGVDLIIAADVSDSMLVEDVKPDRISIEKRKINDLLELVNNDRLALISFAGASFIETPLTLDYGSIKLITDTLGTNLVPLKGSNFYSVANSIKNLINRKGITSNTRSKALITFSDGEFEEETLEKGLEILKENNITPYFIVIGSELGGPVPNVNGGGLKKGDDGKAIISKANLDQLNELAKKANGKAIRYSISDKDIREIYLGDIKQNLKKDKLKSNNVKKWNEYYFIPLVLSVLFIFISWNVKSIKRQSKLISILIFTLLQIQITEAQSNKELRKGEKNYELGDFNEALRHFDNQVETEENAYDKHMATGNTLYRLGKFNEALEEYGKAQSMAQSQKDRAKAVFNAGNSLAQTGNLEKALENYELAKKESPKDEEIENNLKYIKKLIQEQQNQDNKEEKDQDNKESSDQNQQDQSNKDKQESQGQGENKKDSDTKSESENKEEQSEDNKEENNKEQQKQDEIEQSKSTEEKSDKPNPTPNQSKDPRNGNQTSKEENTFNPNDQIESQLESVDENTDAKNQYRYKKALEQLDREQQPLPKMDW